MTTHINKSPVKISASTSHAEADLPPADFNTDGIEVFNPDTSNICFVVTGASPVATNACNFVPPGVSRVFRKSPDVAKISVLMSGGSGATIYVLPSTGFPNIQ